MLEYIGKRILLSIPVMIGVLTVSFLVIRLIPGDPVKLMLGINATPEAVAQVEENLGLDQSLGQQLVSFATGAVSLDFGDSIIRRTSVRELILDRIAPSLYLIVGAVLVAVMLAVPLGVLSAVRRNQPVDHVVRLVSMVAFAMPTFWLGLMLALLFGLELDLLPVSGYGDGLFGAIEYLILPWVTLGLYLAPMLLRTLRTTMIDTMGSEYVEAAHARGLGPRRVIGIHALRPSLIPLITVLSINVGFLISGTVVVENVFQIPGLGSLLVQSVLSRDYPVIQGLVFVFGLMVIAINLLADVTYSLLDPRVRLGAS
ncbi:MAG: ABC transporter permease [Gaiellales bacterium]